MKRMKTIFMNQLMIKSMKIKNLLLAGLVAVALASCSDKEQLESDNSPDGTLKGYITLSISTPETRTTGDGSGGPGVDGTAAENKVNSVHLVLTNASGVVETVVTPNYNSTTKKTDPVQVPAGTHYVYALVNYPGAATTLTGNLIDKVIEVASATDATTGYKNGAFFMTNQCSILPTTTPRGGEEATIKAIHTQNSPLGIFIDVDRVAVKIQYDKTIAPTVTDLGTNSNNLIDAVAVEGFKVLNVSKKFNVVQNWTASGSDWVLNTPLFVSDNVANVSSFYFHHIGEYTKLGKDANGDITDITDLTKGDSYSENDVYVIENRPEYKLLDTSGEYTAGKGETTGVIFKVQAKKSGANVGTFFKYGSTISEDWTVIYNMDKDHLPQTVTEDDYPGLRAKGVQVYEKGVMYYTYFIKDNNSNHQLDNKDYYGVFRNSIYKLHINKINQIGDDVPGGSVNPVDPDPNKPTIPGGGTDPTNPPIDAEETYISVTLTINKWVFNTIDIEF